MSTRRRSVCPHDCPSVCALEVEVLDAHRVGKVQGAKDHSYTRGVICAKVSRYAERIHHPDRLMQPLMRRHGKLARSLAARGREDRSVFETVSWDAALSCLCERFERIRQRYGSEAIWPFHYAGTMGLVQRDGLDRFRRAYATSRQHSTYCVAIADAGFKAGTGVKNGSDARLMHKSELIVVWGGNPVSTQVNVMHHVARAKRDNGAQLVVVDPYRTKTAEKADMHLMLRPGTDAALACAVMHVMFDEGLADLHYLASYTDFCEDFRVYLQARTPAWAAAITGLPETQIRAFARLYGSTPRAFLRIGYGFTRSRNGAVNMHAVSCLPAVSGAWRYEGGGALYGHSSIYKLDRTRIQGLDIPCQTRILDQSRIGRILTGDKDALAGGPPVQALFIQNTNPAVVAPETKRVLTGLARSDLFTVVHEQFMTETAQWADIVLPATMFLEHDDIYTASGHTHLQIGQQLLLPPGECRSNHQVLQSLAKRLGLSHAGFAGSERDLIDHLLAASGLPDFERVVDSGGIDCAPAEFRDANFLNGFATPDKRFHFSPDWSALGANSRDMPRYPDHWPVVDACTRERPLRLVTAPARQFLNTSFTETASSRRMEKQPVARIHPEDMTRYALQNDTLVTLGNELGEVSLKAMAFDGVQAGTVVVESLWPNQDFAGGLGINTLVSSEPAKPDGGAVYHDTAVWVRPGGPSEV